MNPTHYNESDKTAVLRRTGGLATRDIWPLLAIMAAGFLLRVSTITSQSFWVDEYYMTNPLRMPSLSACLRYISFIIPDNVPFYYVLDYAWGCVVGADSLLGARFLSVALGVACIALLYLIVHSLYGRFPAIIAALCLAASPFHIDIAQSTRPNVLSETLALISIYAFIAMLRRNSRAAWIINVVTNALLVWTHLLNVLLLATEGLFILVMLRERPKRIAAWMLALFVAAVSAYLWVASIQSTIPNARDDFYMSVPPLRALASDLLADDAVMSTDSFAFQGETWRFLPEGMQRAIVAAHTQIDTGMVLFFGACLVWLAWQTFVRFRGSWNDSSRRSELATATSSAFLLGVVFLPLCMLVALAFVYRPTLLPRYTSYSSFACYAAAGVAISAIRLKPQRLAALAALLALFAYQLSVALPATTRTNWLGAARLIESDLSPDDLVLVKGTYLSWEVLRFNWRPGKTPVLPAYTLEAISAKSARFLEKTARPDAAARPKVWAIVEPFMYTLPPLHTFEESLAYRGLRFMRTDLAGMNGIHIYRIERNESGVLREPAERIPANVDYSAILADLGYAKDDASALDTLHLMVDAEFPRTPFYYTLLTLQCLDENCLAMGEAAASRALTLDPHHPFALFLRAAILGAKGDAPAALSAYEDAVKNDHSGYLRDFRTLFDAWYRNPDAKAAKDECRRLDRMGYYMPFAFRAKAGLAQQPPYLTTCGPAAP